MAEHWIEARDAARVAKDTSALRERIAAGMIRHRAVRITVDGDLTDGTVLPDGFWSSDGRERLQEDWEAGDFLSSVDGLTQTRAFGVQLEAADVLQMLPVEDRATVARSLSVAGNAAWLTARDARRFACTEADYSPTSADKVIIEQCRLGFIIARAVEMRHAHGSSPSEWAAEKREWDVPAWFWDAFGADSAKSANWETGIFATRTRYPKGNDYTTINGVHFLRSSLDVLLPYAQRQTEENSDRGPTKPRLPDPELRRWWDKLSPVRDKLTQDQLILLAKGEHPRHEVARDRVRALAGARKPGPKSN